MLKPVRFLTKTFLFFALFGLAYFLSDLATWGFTLARLRTSYNLSLPSEGAEPYLYLKQKFYLKAQGGQSYVFKAFACYFKRQTTVLIRQHRDA